MTNSTEEREDQAITGLFEPSIPPVPHQQPSHLHIPPRPPIVALLGDENYAEALRDAAKDRTLRHELVLLPVPSARSLGVDLTAETDRELLALEMARVAMAHYVLVIAPDGFVSPLQAALISHASRLHRPVSWWDWSDRAVSLD